MLIPYLNKNLLEAGCDEAGRGCLAGPVFAAAVILPGDFSRTDLNDSKRLTSKHREDLRDYIQEHAICYSIARVDPDEIDQINILNASILAMHRALENLSIQPGYILVDGNCFRSYKDIPYSTIVKGDSMYLSIAAASVLAKTYRDDYMHSLHAGHPEYDWANNKGYATPGHRRAILEKGTSTFHRKSFRLFPSCS